jgi:hypothetical protein
MKKNIMLLLLFVGFAGHGSCYRCSLLFEYSVEELGKSTAQQLGGYNRAETSAAAAAA